MAPIQKWNFLTLAIKCFGKKDVMNEIKKLYKKSANGFAYIYVRL